MVVMIVVVGVGAVVVVAGLWYLAARNRKAAAVSRADFDREYDELVAKGAAVETERDAAWRDFHAWQDDNERDRLASEEWPEE